jgi:hypothetical protein
VLLACLSLALAGRASPQQPDRTPPEPPAGADLAVLAGWIERWIPTVAAASGSALDSTGDFYSRSSDSVLAARLDGCTLVLYQRSITMVRGWRTARYLAVHVPLAQVDTASVEPKIRRAKLFLNEPNVLVYGQMVVPLRSRSRTEFITIFADGDARYPMLVSEFLVPFVFARAPAARSAAALRQAAARCGAAGPTP